MSSSLNEVAAVWVYRVTRSSHPSVFYHVELTQLWSNCALMVGLVYSICEDNRRFSVILYHKCIGNNIILSILCVSGVSQIWLALLYIRECCQARLICLKCSGLVDPGTYGISVQPVSEVPFLDIPHVPGSSEISSKHIVCQDIWRNTIPRMFWILHTFLQATPMHWRKWLSMKLAELMQEICQTHQNECRPIVTTGS